LRGAIWRLTSDTWWRFRSNTACGKTSESGPNSGGEPVTVISMAAIYYPVPSPQHALDIRGR
jgi:hypothetical protein